MGDVGKPDGMPLLSLTSILHLGLGLPWAFRVGPGTDSERAHLRDMIDELPTGSLLVADAGFIGYDLCRELLARQRHFLLTRRSRQAAGLGDRQHQRHGLEAIHRLFHFWKDVSRFSQVPRLFGSAYLRPGSNELDPNSGDWK